MKTENTLTIEQMVEDARLITRSHLKQWKQWYVLKLDDLESEALFWLVTHENKGKQLYAEKGRKAYINWMSTSLKNLLNRYCQDQIVRDKTFVSMDSHVFSEVEGERFTHHLTYWQVKNSLQKGDKNMLKLAEKYCTEKQYQAIFEVLVSSRPRSEVRNEMGGITPHGVSHHIDRGISNIVSKHGYYTD